MKEAVIYAISRAATSGVRVSKADVPQIFIECMRLLTTGFKYKDISEGRLNSYMEFYNSLEKYLEERCWFIAWRLLELRGIKVKKVIITDRMGGEGLSEFRYYMGRDIDCMVAVESPLVRAREEATRIEEEMNEVFVKELMRMASNGVDYLRDQAYNIFEIEVFDDEKDAERWV